MALGTAVILYVNPVLLTHCSNAPVTDPGAAGAAGFTVIFTGALVAVVGEAQGSLEVITTVTTSPLFKVELVNVVLLVPTFAPFTFH